MNNKNQKTTTYSLDWDTVVNLESRLLRDFQSQMYNPVMVTPIPNHGNPT